MEPISPRGTTHSLGPAELGEAREASEEGDPWLVAHMTPLPSAQH